MDGQLGERQPVHIRAICSQDDTSSVVTISFPNHRFMITATVDDPAHGTVTGSGQYYYGDVATLTAIPNTGYLFSTWSDSNTANPRSLFVTGDTTFIAHFQRIEDSVGIFGVHNPEFIIYPNPANGTVVVSYMGIYGNVRLTVLDLLGREVANYETPNPHLEIDVSALTPGTYFVRVNSEQHAPMMKKLIVK